MVVLIVEGLDGSGKTTAINKIMNLAEKDFSSVEMYRLDYFEIKKGKTEEQARTESFHIYKRKFENYENYPNKLLIMDRAFLTNIAYAREYNYQKDVNFLEEKRGKYVMLLLDISKEVFVERTEIHDHSITYDKNIRDKLIKHGKHFHSIICNSGKLDPDSIAFKAYKEIIDNINKITHS